MLNVARKSKSKQINNLAQTAGCLFVFLNFKVLHFIARSTRNATLFHSTYFRECNRQSIKLTSLS